jgi:hypothetical protein
MTADVPLVMRTAGTDINVLCYVIVYHGRRYGTLHCMEGEDTHTHGAEGMRPL